MKPSTIIGILLSVTVMLVPATHGTVECSRDEREVLALLAERLGAKTEVVLWDRSRADLVLPDAGQIVEVDWIDHWAEGIGQALWYEVASGLDGMLYLVVPAEWSGQPERWRPHAYRALAAAARAHLRVHLWMLHPDGRLTRLAP